MYNKLPRHDVQLEAIKQNYWDDGGVLDADNKFILLGNIIDEINNFLDEVEKGHGDLKAIAKICREMTIDFNRNHMRQFYFTDTARMGIFLMRCMRVNNLATHNSVYLRQFRELFEFLGVKVVGDWGKCEKFGTFGSTSFADNMLIVQFA
jgi:hypothetical protein